MSKNYIDVVSIMKKFLNFSTILCSYILITLLVISCGDGGEASSNNDVNNGTSQPDNQPDDTGDQYSSDSGDQPDDTGDQHSSDSGDQSDDTGDNSGGQASAGSNSKVVQADLSDKTCLLADRADKEAVVAVLCQGYRFIGLIPKATPDQEVQQLYFLIYSIANPDWDSSPISESPSISQLSRRTWDLSEAVQIQISYAKDYTLSLDNSRDGFIDMIADADSTSDEYLLKNLNIPYVLNDNILVLKIYDKMMRSVGITFSPTSGRAVKASISGKLAVQTQEDFISMANFKIPGLTIDESYQLPFLPFLLLNNLSLTAEEADPGSQSTSLNQQPKPKFTSSIIPKAHGRFDFDGGGHKITLESEINTLDNRELTGIIGDGYSSMVFRNFTLDINAPISGRSYYIGIIIGYMRGSVAFKDLKINLNSNLTLYRYSYGHADKSYLGGLVGQIGCNASVNNIVFKTAEDAAIQMILAQDWSSDGRYVGALFGSVSSICGYPKLLKNQFINNSVVDVKIVIDALRKYPSHNYQHITSDYIGILTTDGIYVVNNNLIKVAVSRGENLPVDNYSFGGLAGLTSDLLESTNNLVYLDFSNIGKISSVVAYATRFWPSFSQLQLWKRIISNNMVFIADFKDSDVQLGGFSFISSFYGYTGLEGRVITNSFFSSPFSDSDYTNNSKLSSFINAAYKAGSQGNADEYFSFNNLILDNKTDTVIMKRGSLLDAIKNLVSTANLSTLAEGPDSKVATILKASDSWEAGSQDYPQLKAPEHFSEAKKADWDRINGLIQTELADRAARNQ